MEFGSSSNFYLCLPLSLLLSFAIYSFLLFLLCHLPRGGWLQWITNLNLLYSVIDQAKTLPSFDIVQAIILLSSCTFFFLQLSSQVWFTFLCHGTLGPHLHSLFYYLSYFRPVTRQRQGKLDPNFALQEGEIIVQIMMLGLEMVFCAFRCMAMLVLLGR